MNAYVFILSPPYCGSTLLYKLLATSENVSCLPKEGQFIPEVEDVMRKDVWDPNNAMPWPNIKEAWHQYWDKDKQYLVEKSPPNIIRAEAIQNSFQPAYFIVSVRNPYAYCEGLMRRRVWDEKRAADFCISCLKTQIKNLNSLSNVTAITYEQICDNPDEAISEITTLLPKIGELNLEKEFDLYSIDGQINRRITNLNRKKIHRLPAKSISQINRYFEPHLKTIEFWGYDLYQPNFVHEPRRFWLALVDILSKRVYPKIRKIYKK